MPRSFQGTTDFNDEDLDTIARRTAENYVYMNHRFLMQFDKPMDTHDVRFTAQSQSHQGKLMRNGVNYGVLAKGINRTYWLTKLGKELVEKIGREIKEGND